MSIATITLAGAKKKSQRKRNRKTPRALKIIAVDGQTLQFSGRGFPGGGGTI